MTLLRVGDDVVLEDGREGQVWVQPRPEDWQVDVALGTEFARVRVDSVRVVARQLPEIRDTLHTARLVRGRIDHQCAKCRRLVKAGKEYVRSVVFPGHTSGAAGARGTPGARPHHQDLCLVCASKFRATHPSNLLPKDPS
ncbi:hypothetical protein [Aeromicrobium sp. Root495]|uniref:hypothetical protein n=1 Tax=Aeromicrobium sp. Root495 TaxID=1736550 RepID=UPI000A7D9C5C|nr:hypothetical protein [Aeromicrobium sp. Root495]